MIRGNEGEESVEANEDAKGSKLLKDVNTAYLRLERKQWTRASIQYAPPPPFIAASRSLICLSTSSASAVGIAASVPALLFLLAISTFLIFVHGLIFEVPVARPAPIVCHDCMSADSVGGIDPFTHCERV